MSPAVGESLDAYLDLKDFCVVRPIGAYGDILWRSHLFRLRPLLQAALWIMDLVEDEFLRGIQQGMDKCLHRWQPGVQVQRADDRFKQRSEQPVALAPARGKFTAPQAKRRSEVQVPRKGGKLVIAHDGRADLC